MRLLPALALCGASLFSSWLGAVELTHGTPDYGVLIISRERLEIATACDIGVYLQDQLVSRLFRASRPPTTCRRAKSRCAWASWAIPVASPASSRFAATAYRSAPAPSTSTG